MGVSKNRGGSPKSSILIGFSIIFTIHFGDERCPERGLRTLVDLLEGTKLTCLPWDIHMDVSKK